MKATSIELYDDGIGKVDYISHMGSDLSVVNSTRVSSAVEKQELDQKDVRLINYLIKNNHGSAMEHGVITFRFTVPLFVRTQHHRHREWSYSEINKKYTDIDIKFYEPKEFRPHHEFDCRTNKPDEAFNPLIDPWNARGGNQASYLVLQHNKDSLNLYEKLIKNGICRSQALGVLPQNLYTQYYGTTNLNNLMKFVSEQKHDSEQQEIQKVAVACLKIAKQLFPATVGAYVELNNM